MSAKNRLSFGGNQGAIRLATGIWNDNGLVEYQNTKNEKKKQPTVGSLLQMYTHYSLQPSICRNYGLKLTYR